ncbi:SusD family protein [Lutibacter oricola]|uniref:SusD family protein n=1 Tax=Lutibacter oricola TaxID=762486 RepID=A0A1H2Z157_9FLAO|nr:RagB/SusD family nutrient uptake outer membrane protein [Lutibacter oricola]SDX11057.1 SusD family protein [Lutibacter oricola]
MKIKNIKYIIGLFSIMVSIIACNDIELDPVQQDAVDSNSAIQDLTSATAAVDGMYDLLYRVDYYGRELMVIPEVSADNILVSPSNSGRFISNYTYAITTTNGDVEGLWTNMYKNINAANAIMFFAPNVTSLTTEQLNEILGHAYAIRGMAHFDLVKTYAFPYTTTDASVAPGANGTGGHLGVPLLSTYGQEEDAARATVAEVYAMIISDLTKASSLLPTSAYSASSKFNSTAAKALLSRVYLYKGDYPKAFTTAQSVIADSQYSLTSNANYASDWAGSVSSSEAILQLPAFQNDHNGFDALASIYVPDGDDGNKGYGDLIPTTDILALYSDNDVRKTWFRDIADVTYNFKFPNSWTNDIPLIRISEMYLTVAEAAANGAGTIEAGQDALNEIILRADPSATPTTSTGQPFLDEVLLERRKELAFEGHRLYDIVRNENDMVRTDLATASTLSELTYPDYRMILPIPQLEIDVNDSINENNTGY